MVCQATDRELQPLILGEYVRVEIEGEELHEVFRIPRTALRNDREIWVAAGDGRLAIRPVEIIWRDEMQVLVRDGLQVGDLLIVSNLAVPVDGMAVRVDQGTGPEWKQCCRRQRKPGNRPWQGNRKHPTRKVP